MKSQVLPATQPTGPYRDPLCVSHSYLIAELGLRSPDDPENVFATLGQESIISPDLARSMTGMVRFHNILVHDYLEIDSEIVYRGLTTELDDSQLFAREIAGRFLSSDC